LFRFGFYSSHCIYRRRMRTYQYTAFTVVDRYDTLYAVHKSDAGVGVDFKLIWIWLLHNVLKRVRKRTARSRFVFGIKDGLLNVRRILLMAVRIPSLILIT
jgi:hypothetical protein